MKLSEEDKKLVLALYSARHLERLNAFFKREYDSAMKSLIAANPDAVQRVQGRAQLLDELIAAFKVER